jgi:hypothetical protein
VAPEVSVVYRFAAACLLLAAVCVATGRSLRFRARDHAGDDLVAFALQPLADLGLREHLLASALRFSTTAGVPAGATMLELLWFRSRDSRPLLQEPHIRAGRQQANACSTRSSCSSVMNGRVLVHR